MAIPDDTIIIGRKHPYNYGLAILSIMHRKGYCIVQVDRKAKFFWKQRAEEKTNMKLWNEIYDMLKRRGFRIEKEAEETKGNFLHVRLRIVW